jgi:hypothetical protein
MTTFVPVAVSPLRQRPNDEMDIRRFGHETQRNYIRDVGRFATFVGRSRDVLPKALPVITGVRRWFEGPPVSHPGRG